MKRALDTDAITDTIGHMANKKACCHNCDIDTDEYDTEYDTDDDGWSDLKERYCGTLQLLPANVLSWGLERGQRPDEDDEEAWKIWNSLVCQDPTHFLPCHCEDCLAECPCQECEDEPDTGSVWDKHLQCWCSLCVPPILQLSKIGSTEMCNNPNCRRPLTDKDTNPYFCHMCVACVAMATGERDFCPQCFVICSREEGGHTAPACK